jgi:hypothetical protein
LRARAADVVDEEPHVVLEGVDDTILAQGPLVSPLVKNKQVWSSLIRLDNDKKDEEEKGVVGDETDDGEGGDVILGAGPPLLIKAKDPEPLSVLSTSAQHHPHCCSKCSLYSIQDLPRSFFDCVRSRRDLQSR